jgi:hypothetical protein
LLAQYPAGSGLGVSVLLRQPHGFKGFGLRLKDARPNDSTTPQRKDVVDSGLDGAPGATPTSVCASDCDNAVAGIDEFCDFGVPKLPRVDPAEPEALRRFDATVDLWLGTDRPRPIHFDLRVTQLSRSIEIDSIPSVVKPANDLQFSRDIARAVSRRSAWWDKEWDLRTANA